MKICIKCGNEFPTRIIINGVQRNLQSRKYCLDCSPFGEHNTQPLYNIPVGLKKCPVCQELKPLDSFYSKPDRKSKSGYCKECTSKKRAELSRKIKEQMVEYKGGSCVICGYSKYAGALEFHHINPEEKDPDFRKMRNWTFERKKAELSKCILVCSNCHREIHAGLVEEYRIG